MEKMKSKFVENINSLYNQVVSLEKEINEGYSKVDPNDKFDKLNLGGKMLNLSHTNTELFKTIDLFFSIAEGTLEELPENVRVYYNQIEELKKPLSENTPEDIKKLKEFLNSIENKS